MESGFGMRELPGLRKAHRHDVTDHVTEVFHEFILSLAGRNPDTIINLIHQYSAIEAEQADRKGPDRSCQLYRPDQIRGIAARRNHNQKIVRPGKIFQLSTEHSFIAFVVGEG